MSLEEAASKLQKQFQIIQRTDFRGETTLELPLDQIEEACKFAKEQLGFNFLSDLSSVDNFGEEPRFEVVYELYSLESNIHLRLKARVSEEQPGRAICRSPLGDRELARTRSIRHDGYPVCQSS